MIIESNLTPLANYTHIYDKETNKDVKHAGINYIISWDIMNKEGKELRVVKEKNDPDYLYVHAGLSLPNSKTVFIFKNKNEKYYKDAITISEKYDDVEVRVE